MNIRELVDLWEDHAQGLLTQEKFQVRLTLEDAAKIEALTEMYPRRSKEQLISELVSAALADLETSFPYREGTTVVTTDEEGDPIYQDIGPTSSFQDLTRKYLAKYRAANS